MDVVDGEGGAGQPALGDGLPGEAVAARMRPSQGPELVTTIFHGFAANGAGSGLFSAPVLGDGVLKSVRVSRLPIGSNGQD